MNFLFHPRRHRLSSRDDSPCHCPRVIGRLPSMRREFNWEARQLGRGPPSAEMLQKPLSERTYSRSRRSFFDQGGKSCAAGEGRSGWFWRSPEGRLMPLSSTRQRFANLVRVMSPFLQRPPAAELAARAATSAIPIVFGANDDPVKLVVSFVRSGSNATGINRPGVGLQAFSLPAVGPKARCRP
jgi:hypothetical protein